MMKTEMTTTLYNLVQKELHPSARIMTQKQINDWQERLHEISAGLFQMMTLLVFSRISNRLVNRHIRQLQHESICLLDTLQGYQDIPEKMLVLHQSVLNMLETVLAHIEIHYPRFFNLDLAVPVSLFQVAIADVESKMDIMLSRLNSKSNDKVLKKLIHDSLVDFTKANRCTYYRLTYIKSLQASVIELCENVDRVDGNERLRELLIYLNLNTAAHLKYYKKNIAAQLAEIFDVQEQDELLFAYQRQLRAINPQSDIGFNPQQEGIKTTLLDYIRTEIKYRNKTRTVVVPAYPNKQDVLWSRPPDSYKIQLAFSVDALAYFFKLLVKVGLINTGTREQLLQFVSKSFKTVATESISPNSLSRKYDQVTQTTAKAVKVVLLRMLKMLDEEFN